MPTIATAVALNEAPADVDGEPKAGPLVLPEMLALAAHIGACMTSHAEELDIDKGMFAVIKGTQVVPVKRPACIRPAESRHKKEIPITRPIVPPWKGEDCIATE